jgi:hypothetical protein
MRSRTAALVGGMLAVAGGVLMIASGFAAHGLLLSSLPRVEGLIPRYIGAIPGFTLTIAVYFVALIISLGVFTIVAGGLTILLRHRTIGRILVALGGGAGLIGLLLTFGYTVYRLGLGVAIGNVPYWRGLVFAVVGRRFASRS